MTNEWVYIILCFKFRRAFGCVFGNLLMLVTF